VIGWGGKPFAFIRIPLDAADLKAGKESCFACKVEHVFCVTPALVKGALLRASFAGNRKMSRKNYRCVIVFSADGFPKQKKAVVIDRCYP
jgi:hypothetical protein